MENSIHEFLSDEIIDAFALNPTPIKELSEIRGMLEASDLDVPIPDNYDCSQEQAKQEGFDEVVQAG